MAVPPIDTVVPSCTADLVSPVVNVLETVDAVFARESSKGSLRIPKHQLHLVINGLQQSLKKEINPVHVDNIQETKIF